MEGILLDTQHIIRDRKEEDLTNKNQEAETNLPYLHHWQLHYLLHPRLRLEKGVTEEVIIQIIYLKNLIRKLRGSNIEKII